MSALWHPTNCEKLQKIKIPKIDLFKIFAFLFNHFCKHPISYFTQLCFIKRSLASYCKGKKSRKSFFFLDQRANGRKSWSIYYFLRSWVEMDFLHGTLVTDFRRRKNEFENRTKRLRKVSCKMCRLLSNELILIKNKNMLPMK